MSCRTTAGALPARYEACASCLLMRLHGPGGAVVDLTADSTEATKKASAEEADGGCEAITDEQQAAARKSGVEEAPGGGGASEAEEDFELEKEGR